MKCKTIDKKMKTVPDDTEEHVEQSLSSIAIHSKKRKMKIIILQQSKYKKVFITLLTIIFRPTCIVLL